MHCTVLGIQEVPFATAWMLHSKHSELNRLLRPQAIQCSSRLNVMAGRRGRDLHVTPHAGFSQTPDVS